MPRGRSPKPPAKAAATRGKMARPLRSAPRGNDSAGEIKIAASSAAHATAMRINAVRDERTVTSLLNYLTAGLRCLGDLGQKFDGRKLVCLQHGQHVLHHHGRPLSHEQMQA